eukprot:797050-Prorocentrum_minimum.AAC.1
MRPFGWGGGVPTRARCRGVETLKFGTRRRRNARAAPGQRQVSTTSAPRHCRVGGPRSTARRGDDSRDGATEGSGSARVPRRGFGVP